VSAANGDLASDAESAEAKDDALAREENSEQSESGKSPLSIVRDIGFVALVIAYLSGFTYYYALMTDFGLPITLTDVPVYQFVVYAYVVYSSTRTILIIVAAAAVAIALTFLTEWLDRRYFSGPVLALLELLGELFERGRTEGLPLGPLKMSEGDARFLERAISSFTVSIKALRMLMFLPFPTLFRLINKRAYKPILAVTAALMVGAIFFFAADAAHVQYEALRSTGTSNKDIFGVTQFSAEHRIRFAFRKDGEAVYPHDFRLANNALSLQILNESKDQYQVLILRPLKPGQPTIARLYARVFSIRKADVVYYTSVTM
jgi:hypothetical protein